MRKFPQILLVLLICTLNSKLRANSDFALDGIPFKTDASISWSTNHIEWPSNVVVYKVLPQNFGREWVSNVLLLVKLAGTPASASDGKKSSWKISDKLTGTLLKTLEIEPSSGFLNYHNYELTSFSTNALGSVPKRQQIDSLALNVLQYLGGDTNQLSLKSHAGTERNQKRMNRKTGKRSEVVTLLRGAMYARQIDSIRFLGAGGRGGMAIDFASETNIASLELDWRRLERFKTYSTLNREELLQQIRSGKAHISSENGDIPAHPTALTISKVTLYYMSQLSCVPEDSVFPIANIEIKTEGDDSATFYVDCPIIKL